MNRDEIYAGATEDRAFSNGATAHLWMERWCERCIHDSPEMVERGEGCPMLTLAVAGWKPAEWTSENGSQDYECSEFVGDPAPLQSAFDVIVDFTPIRPPWGMR